LQYLDDQLAFAKENMYVETITGRKVFTPNVNATNPMSRVHAELSAKNSGIQGSAADIVKKAMLDIAQSGILGDYVEIVMQVHDELVFYVSKDVEEQVKGKIVSIMENAYSLAVPLVVDIKSGKNWREAH
jgi:DNA polymerase-1